MARSTILVVAVVVASDPEAQEAVELAQIEIDEERIVSCYYRIIGSEYKLLRKGALVPGKMRLNDVQMDILFGPNNTRRVSQFNDDSARARLSGQGNGRTLVFRSETSNNGSSIPYSTLRGALCAKQPRARSFTDSVKCIGCRSRFATEFRIVA